MRIVPSIENASRGKPGTIARRRKRDTVKYRVILYSLRSQTGRARRMLQPQELVVARLLPTIRARLARELLHTYKMKQVDVARSMGITQAAVSHYNTQSRGVDQEMLRLFPGGAVAPRGPEVLRVGLPLRPPIGDAGDAKPPCKNLAKGMGLARRSDDVIRLPVLEYPPLQVDERRRVPPVPPRIQVPECD